jgi:hypothetical protein
MRGGKREGAGRKPSESTVRISVPVGVLDRVQALIQTYKLNEIADDSESGALLSQLQTLKSVSSNKQVSTSQPQSVKPKTNTQRKQEQKRAKKKKR